MNDSMIDCLGSMIQRILSNKRACTTDVLGFSDAVDEFCKEMGTLNCWSDATYVKFKCMKHHVLDYDEDAKMEQMNETWLIGFVRELQNEELHNSTIRKQIELLKWFLKWAFRRGYVKQKEWMDFSPRLKTGSHTVIFLTWDELCRVKNLQFCSDEAQLEIARDLFCLECFTSLRYSDVKNLKLAQVRKNSIEVVTKKTNDKLVIELNKYSRDILQKYAGKCGEWAMPQLSMQWVNKLLKEVCKRAEISEKVQKIWYNGNERVEDIHEKWELVSTHCGRRTFICNSLAMGIPPEVVMKWTGHSNYSAMKPYIDIADKERAKAMKLWDER